MVFLYIIIFLAISLLTQKMLGTQGAVSIGSLLRIFLYLFDSVSKRETAVSHYTDTVYKSVNLLVHIETQ